jgi:hypothetical protein
MGIEIFGLLGFAFVTAEEGTSLTAANELAIRRTLETAGVEFIDENGGGPGVRLRKSGEGKSKKMK